MYKLCGWSYTIRLPLPTIGKRTVFHNRGEREKTQLPLFLSRFMKHSFSPPTDLGLNKHWAEPRLTSRHSNKHAFADDVANSSVDIHMRLVADLEDSYWRTHFSTQGFYVAGRGYDQYQPALALGWNGALQNPDGYFEDFVEQLEVRWMAHSGTSFLPWSEVAAAVKDAWMHARWQMQTLQQQVPTTLGGRELMEVMQPLYRGCVKTAAELQSLATMPLNDFVKQVIDRHLHLMQNLARGLRALFAGSAGNEPVTRPWVGKFQKQWTQLKLQLVDCSPEDFLALCEQRERKLLAAYHASLNRPLPPEAKDVLQQQLRQLENQVQKLSWVRHNWSIQ